MTVIIILQLQKLLSLAHFAVIQHGRAFRACQARALL